MIVFVLIALNCVALYLHNQMLMDISTYFGLAITILGYFAFCLGLVSMLNGLLDLDKFSPVSWRETSVWINIPKFILILQTYILIGSPILGVFILILCVFQYLFSTALRNYQQFGKNK